MAKILDGALETGDIAMMIRTEEIHEPVEAPGELVVMVGDVRKKIGVAAIGFDQYAVFVIAIFLCVEEESSFAFIAIRLQFFQDIFDCSTFTNRLFGSVDVLIDPEGMKILLDEFQKEATAIFLEEIDMFPSVFHVSIADLVLETLCDADDFLAVVTILRNRGVDAEKLEIAGDEGLAEMIDLVAGIVDVVFPGDVIARLLQDAADAVSQGSPSGMTEMERARRIGGDIFYVDRRPLSERDIAEVLLLVENLLDDLPEFIGLEEEVDKTGLDRLAFLKAVEPDPVRDLLGQGKWGQRKSLRLLKGDVRRVVAMLPCIAGGKKDFLLFDFHAQLLQNPGDFLLDGVLNIQLFSPNP